jgi:hypothetical protein
MADGASTKRGAYSVVSPNVNENMNVEGSTIENIET